MQQIRISEGNTSLENNVSDLLSFRPCCSSRACVAMYPCEPVQHVRSGRMSQQWAQGSFSVGLYLSHTVVHTPAHAVVGIAWCRRVVEVVHTDILLVARQTKIYLQLSIWYKMYLVGISISENFPPSTQAELEMVDPECFTGVLWCRRLQGKVHNAQIFTSRCETRKVWMAWCVVVWACAAHRRSGVKVGSF